MLPGSHVRISPQFLSCSKNASKPATRNQTRSLRNYSKDLGDALHSSKSKWEAARTIQLAHKLETDEKPIKTERFPKKSSLEGNGGNMEEVNKRKYDRLGKSLQERARLKTILWDFARGAIILGVLEIPCTHQKSKWAAASWKKNYKHRMLSLSHSFRPRVLWKEMKGMWEKCGEVWADEDDGWTSFCGNPQVFFFFCSTIEKLYEITSKHSLLMFIAGYIEGLDYNSHISICTTVGPLLRKII